MSHRQEIENQFRKFESALKRLEEVLLIVFEFFYFTHNKPYVN